VRCRTHVDPGWRLLSGKHFGGSGVLLGGVPGVLPGRVVVLGAALLVSTLRAWLKGWALMSLFSRWTWNECRFLDITLHTRILYIPMKPHLLELLPAVDLLIGAVLLPAPGRPS